LVAGFFAGALGSQEPTCCTVPLGEDDSLSLTWPPKAAQNLRAVHITMKVCQGEATGMSMGFLPLGKRTGGIAPEPPIFFHMMFARMCSANFKNTPMVVGLLSWL
jgi:hypothetical protein